MSIDIKRDITKDVALNWYQDVFMFNEERYSALIAAVGTGKTFAGLMRAWQYCQEHPGALGLIVRREYIDLKNSTMKDFEMNFNVKIGSDKSYKFENGSQIIFTHGDMTDLNVLKNINLSFFIIEQAEEFEGPEIFDFLRDRLRRQGSGNRWGGLIANAMGHNWIFERFITGAKAKVHNKDTGEVVYTKERYVCATANSFANAHNLPSDFIDDLKAMELESPTHYKQYVMNDFNVVDADDLLFTPEELALVDEEVKGNISNKFSGADVARFGKDRNVAVIVEEISGMKLRQTVADTWSKKDAVYSVGRISAFGRDYRVDAGVIDGDGLGGPMYDSLKELVSGSYRLKEFRNTKLSKKENKDYANTRTMNYFQLKEKVAKGWVQITSPEVKNDLASIRYTFNRDGQKMMIPKEVLRARGLKSPDYGDAFMMIMSLHKQSDAYHSTSKGKRKFRRDREYNAEVDY